jgi:hypothetical protein
MNWMHAQHLAVGAHFIAPAVRQPPCLEPVQSLAEVRIAALKQAEKYSRTACTLRFFSLFRLALHPLIETLNRLLENQKDAMNCAATFNKRRFFS